MSAIQYLSTFRLYGWDVLLLAGAVTLLTALLKKTVLKNASRKLYVFLPFAIGILLYAAYRGLVTLSPLPFTYVQNFAAARAINSVRLTAQIQ